MKCLSLWQPWASLLVHGKKRVETRGWAISHRGPLLIHAAQHWTSDEAALCGIDPFRAALLKCGVSFSDRPRWRDRVAGLPFGAIVGRVDVVDCTPTHSVVTRVDAGEPGYFEGWINSVLARYLVINDTEKAFGDYSPNRFAFHCKNPVAFDKPIPFRGAQGLFDVPADVLRGAA